MTGRITRGRPLLLGAALAMATGACAHKPQEAPRAAALPAPVQAAQDALKRAQGGIAESHAPQALKRAQKTVQQAVRAAGAADGDTRATDLAYLACRQVQLAESEGARRAALQRAAAMQEALAALHQSGQEDAVQRALAAQRAELREAWERQGAPAGPQDEGPWQHEPGLGLVLPLKLNALFDADSTTLTARGTAVLDRVARVLADRPRSAVALAFGSGTSPDALARGRLTALGAYLRAQGLRTRAQDDDGVPLRPTADAEQHQRLYVVVPDAP